MDEVRPGDTVHRYRVEGLLGRGGMGSVWRAIDTVSGAAVAVKTMHKEIAERPMYRKRFLREARAAMAVPHPSIVKILEVFEHGGTPMLAIELLDGESLEQLVERENKLPLDRLARVLIHVASALGTAHTLGIVHRDLKPENVFLARDGSVKVLDFGIAKLKATEGLAMETQALTRTGTLMGTPYYMSPEQAFGDKNIDQRADVWSFGIMTYRCLSGVMPTKAAAFGEVFRLVVEANFTPIEQLVPGLPADVAALVSKMLQRTPDDRPWDLREVFEVLERHARETAPSFGEAVAPEVIEEISLDEPGSSATAIPAPEPAATAHSAPLGLTPARLRAAPRAPGWTPSGTLLMEAPAKRAEAVRATPGDTTTAAVDPSATGTLAPVPMRGAPWGRIAAVLVALAAAAVVLWRLRG